MFLYGILAMLAVSANCILMPHKLDAPKELVQVNFMNTHEESHRFRRSVDGKFNFPEVLIPIVNINGTDVTLTLHISHVNNLQHAVYTFSDNGTLIREDAKDNSKRALYQDVNAGASYLVTCEVADPEQCELHGSFYHENNKYHMTASQTAGLHELYNLGEESRNFTNDARTPPDHIANENTKPYVSRTSTRPKRALPDANIVEFVAITDDSVYNSFLAQTEDHTEAVDAMDLYYALLINEVDLHYLSVPVVDPSLRIRVALKYLYYASNCDQTPWSCDNTVTLNGVTYLDANNALDSFTAWRNNLRQSLFPTHDHAMAFTMKNFEFVSGGSATDGLAGQAWVGQVCRSWDTSVTEDNGFRTGTVAAHELGHSLGAKHDSDSGPCPNSALNVMTTTVYRTTSQDKAEAQWTFSSCSVDDFRNHINRLGSNCMRSTDISDDALDGPLALPGEYYSLDQQCQMSGGSSVTSCTSGTRVSESACYSGTWCSSSSTCSNNYYRTYPLAGTPCGSSGENKWCYRGLCVAKPTIATTTTTSAPTTTTASVTTTTTTIAPTTTKTTTTIAPTTTTTNAPTVTTTTAAPTTTTTIAPTTTKTTTTIAPTTTTTNAPTTTTTTAAPTTTTTIAPITTTTAPEIDYCMEQCCKKNKKGKTKCCRGKRCCRKRWGRKLSCCTQCRQ